MQTNPESAAVEAVAVVMRDGYICWLTSWLMSENYVKSQQGDKLYPQSALDALRGEVAENEGVIRVWRRRCEEAERRAAELYGVLSDAVGSLYRMDITKLDAGDKHKLDVLLDRLQTAITLRQEKPE